MLNYKYTSTLLFLLLLIASSCSDVFIDDLGEDEVQLRAPVDGLVTNVQAQAFWWDPLEDNVDGYRIEVVSPRFDSIVELIINVDITEGTIYETTLAPGDYQWTVIAYNSRNETEPMIYDLHIDSDTTMNLDGQNLVQVFPENNMHTNETDITFLWQEIEDASNYRIQIASPDFSNSTFFVLDESTTSDFYATTLAEGDYRWRVRAENETGVSPYSTFNVSVDLTAPVAPELLSPTSGDTLALPITLAWEADVDVTLHTIYVATDSLFTNQILESETNTSNYIFTDNTSNRYYWRLKSTDAAGNESSLSATRVFYVE